MEINKQKKYLIHGGQRLEGTVTVQSAKNAINKQLVASILTDEPCIFENLPRITEIEGVLAMLSQLGTKYEWLDDSTLQIQTENIKQTIVGQEYSGFNRIPILLLGPLLHRANEVTVSLCWW